MEILKTTANDCKREFFAKSRIKEESEGYKENSKKDKQRLQKDK
jgi:hypothetical protein